MNWIYGNEMPELITKSVRLGQPVFTANAFVEETDSEEGAFRWMSVTLPPATWGYAELVDAFILLGYPNDRMDAVTNNYIANQNSMETAQAYTEMQRWRGRSKVEARKYLRYSVENGICTDDFAEAYDDLANVRSMVLQQVENYDISDDVNAFVFNGMGCWLTKQMRESLLTSIGRFQKAGIETFPFSIDGVQMELPCDVLDGMITRLEIYATQAMAVTNSHLQAVRSLQAIDEILEYDYKQGYPEKIVFDV